jgi:hypothetical protein
MVHHVLRLVSQALCSYGVEEEDRVAILDASFVHFETMVKVGHGGARGATGNLSEHRVMHYDMCSPGGSHDPKVAMVQQAVFQGVGPGRVLELLLLLLLLRVSVVVLSCISQRFFSKLIDHLIKPLNAHAFGLNEYLLTRYVRFNAQLIKEKTFVH